MSAIDEMLQFNRGVVRLYPGVASKTPPRRRLAIVTCMDARIVPATHFGIHAGDAHIIRNGGGRIAEAIRSLALSQVLLGTEEVAIIHHTDCGLMSPGDEAVRAAFREKGVDPGAMPFLTFADLEQSVRDDIALYRATPILRQDIPVRGLVFDVATCRLREIDIPD
jgi:carbonic anhydrase